ncbi:hypothetical protein E5K00_15705 [Hymenobacter aquaticus]|uniref:Lipocalin-like domain-containing protein n=1 Tax=Hymenobacter aquaticus TaxID=1867101 RepID=A0A4Z0PWQ7_9BACT|nr:hypothetical protein [Hymenobacter aquaticus]TGE21716.1 hypothetical protein E5K00_15705 [Hymenobacter aquaticus]
MFLLPVRRLALVPLGFLVLLSACTKDAADAEPAELRGVWKLDKQTVKTTDAAGVSQEVTDVLSRPDNHLEIADTTWTFTHTTGFREHYSYTRPTDSTIVLRHYAGAQAVDTFYSLLEVRAHRLTTRLSYALGDGGRTTVKCTYSR